MTLYEFKYRKLSLDKLYDPPFIKGQIIFCTTTGDYFYDFSDKKEDRKPFNLVNLSFLCKDQLPESKIDYDAIERMDSGSGGENMEKVKCLTEKEIDAIVNERIAKRRLEEISRYGMDGTLVHISAVALDPKIAAAQANNCIEMHKRGKYPEGDRYGADDLHEDLDAIMCTILEQLGYKEFVKIFNEAPKWYS